MDVGEYISIDNQQLKDKDFYKKLNEDPKRKHGNIVNNIIESLKKQELLFTSTAKKLTISNIRTQQFHISPNLHKSNILERPVVSLVECHTSKISKFFHHYLTPHAEALPYYIKDTGDFIKKLLEQKNIRRDISCHLRCKTHIHQYSKP